MGAENSILEGCQWGDEVLGSGLDWDLQHADTKDGRPITVFQPRRNERKYNDFIQRLAKSLKMLRHPSILRYIGAGKSVEGHFLVTEQATPLASVLGQLSPVEMCSGLCDILDALIFLHDKAGVAHNNVCGAAIFVSQDGSWRLGELQHACPFKDATPQYLETCRTFRDQDALAPEEKQSSIEGKGGDKGARDMYGIGVLMEQLSEHLSELEGYDKRFEDKIASCLSTDPSHRPSALELNNDKLFQTDFIQILSFVRNVALKSSEEKDEFFSGLLPRLQLLPEELVARRLVIPLLSRFVLLEEAAVTHVVPHLLTPRPESDVGCEKKGTALLGAELFKSHVIPELQRIVLVHDAHIRLVLLQHFSSYAPLFPTDVLRCEIFPQILLGLRDSSDAIVASSLRALADLVPLLGGDVVIGGQRKTFFFHGMPKFSPVRETEPAASTVSEVLKPACSIKSVSLANGKPLLKDLAAGLSSKSSIDVDHERKQAERERRREEARKRKEERQRKFKLLQIEREKEEEDDLDKPVSAEASETTIAVDDVKQTTSQRTAHDSDNTNLNNKILDSQQESDDDDDSLSEHNKVEADRNVRVEEETFASEQSEEDWEDWEDKGNNSAQDDIISDEIEAELSLMSKSPRGGGKKIPTSPDPYSPSSPTDMTWSDSQFESISISSKSLHEDLIKKPNQKTNQLHSVSSPKSEKSSELKASSGKGLKLVAKNKAATSAKTTPVKKSVNDDLGLGYDIKSIELSVVKEEEDFFADMTPQIKPKKDVFSAGLDKGSKPGEVTTQDAGLSLFAVTDAATEESAGWDDQESAGWDDEGDWGTDNF